MLDPTVNKESPKLFWLTKFDGLNLHDDRRAIGDQEMAWCENFIPLGAGNARTIYDRATSIYTAANTIVYRYGFNIGSVNYQAIFMNDGSAVAVRVDTAAVTSIAVAGTFAVTPTLPHCAQYGNYGIIIVTADTNGYFAWDGTLYQAGGTAPLWLTELSAVITTTGNVSLTTTIAGMASTAGIEIGMRVAGSGVVPNTLVQTVSAAGTSIVISVTATASATGVTLTFDWLMPSGLKGTAVEVYANRVWIVNGGIFTFSAPANGTDFSTSNGGGSQKSTDSFLKTKFMNLKQANGFLYLFGDSSVNVISNVQTLGSPATTTYNNQNVDPQTGLGWRDSLVAFGRALCFANPTGVYAMFGGAAQKISDKIDALFETLVTTTVTPTMFVTTIFGVKCLGIVMNSYDPTLPGHRTMLILWNGQKWFTASQTLTSIYVNTHEINSTPTAWGDDGTHVYELFQSASTSLTKMMISKLWSGDTMLNKKTARAAYTETDDLGGTGVSVTGTIDSDTNLSTSYSITQGITWVNNSNQIIQFQNNLAQNIFWFSNYQGLNGTTINQAGRRLGITMSSTTADFTLIGMGLTYQDESYTGR